MKKTTAITMFILACATHSLRAGILAGPVTNSANGHVYYLLTQSHWSLAEQEAKSLGGHLATIDDAAEQTWVFSTFTTNGGVDRTLLIGLNDLQDEGVWRWANGAPVTYTNWRNGVGVTEPSGGTNENVAMMFPACSNEPGTWNDVGLFGESAVWCGPGTSSLFHGVVEIDPIELHIQVSQVAVSWNSSLDINYQVQYVSALTSNTWANLGGPLLGTGTNITVLDSVLGQPQKFYRVISVP